MLFVPKTRLYTVYVNPAAPDAYENPDFVEEGFNWPVFLFGAFGALYYRLWIPAIVMMAVSALIGWLRMEQLLHPVSIMAVHLGCFFLFGAETNDWRRGHLKRQGWIVADLVSGDSQASAQQRFFDRYFARTRAAALPSPVSSSTGR